MGLQRVRHDWVTNTFTLDNSGQPLHLKMGHTRTITSAKSFLSHKVIFTGSRDSDLDIFCRKILFNLLYLPFLLMSGNSIIIQFSVQCKPWQFFLFFLVMLLSYLSFDCWGIHFKEAPPSMCLFLNILPVTGLNSQAIFPHWVCFVLEILVDFNNWSFELLFLFFFLGFKFLLLSFKFTHKEWAQKIINLNKTEPQVFPLFFPCDLTVRPQEFCVTSRSCKVINL